MADGNAVTAPKKTKVRGPRKEKSLALQAEYFSRRLAKLQSKLDETKSKIPPKVLKTMKLIEELENA